MLDKVYDWTIQYMNWCVNFYATHAGLTKAILVGGGLAAVAILIPLIVYSIREITKAVKAK